MRTIRGVVGRASCALGLLSAAIALSGCAGFCTLPPAQPAGGPSDWYEAVHANCQPNLLRLGRWTGGTAPLKPTDSPAKYFAPVGAFSLPLETKTPQNIYVVVHGWAPGYKAAVDGDPLIHWWSSDATSGGTWASDWAWAPTTVSSPALNVSSTGLFQQIQAHDPGAVVLGYSWIDDSATGDTTTSMIDVYQSEAYTCINGLRLAWALEEAISPAAFFRTDWKLHLIGHSHGSKVATVAAAAMQRLNLHVDHLTLLDPPEVNTPLESNGANFLPFYLKEMKIAADPSPGTTFVDNYPSCFGVVYRGAPALNEIVNVVLTPTNIWKSNPEHWADEHSYSAEWYAGAAAAVSGGGPLATLGLDWPPVPDVFTPALNQTWPGGVTNAAQWKIAPGSPLGNGAYTYSFPALVFDWTQPSGSNVTFQNGVLTMKGVGGQVASLHGRISTQSIDQYGVGLTFSWTGGADGDYVVVAVASGVEREPETVLVLDGRSMTTQITGFPISFCADATDPLFTIYYLPGKNNNSGVVTMQDFRAIVVAD